jgi:hypothetical protein
MGYPGEVLGFPVVPFGEAVSSPHAGVAASLGLTDKGSSLQEDDIPALRYILCGNVLGGVATGRVRVSTAKDVGLCWVAWNCVCSTT